MKKIILTAAIVLGMVSANAQEVKFGAKAGLNVASVYNSEDKDDDRDNAAPVYSFHVGGFAEFKFGKLAVQPELLYSVQGQGYKYDEENSTVLGLLGKVTKEKQEFKGSTKLGYINIPVMVKYYVMDNLSVEAGPQIGFLLNTKTRGTINGENPMDSLKGEALKLAEKAQDKRDEETKDHLKSIDFGMNFGATFNVTEQISISGRYCLGLIDLEKDRSDYDKSSDKHGVIQVSVGYTF